MLRPGKGFYKRPSSVAVVVSMLLALLIVPMALVLTAHAGTESSTWKWVQTNGPYGARTTCLAVNGTNLFAGAYGGGIFRSNNNATSWTSVNNGLTNMDVICLAVNGTSLFAGTEDGIFLSTNNGISWTAVNSILRNTCVWDFAISGTHVFAGTSGGVFLSTDNGTNWTEVNKGLTNMGVNALAVSGTSLFAGTEGDGVFMLPDAIR